MDADTGEFYFIEVNPRIQVEHTVTEVVTGIDIVKAQIRIAEGATHRRRRESACRAQDDIRLNGHALQCRITTEDPENNFIPDYGRITAYRGATGFGIRLDGGTAYSGAVITRFYDSLLVKVTAWAPTPEEAIAPHGPGAARVPHPRRRDQPRLPRERHRPPELPRRRATRPGSSTRRRSCSSSAKRRDRATKLLTYHRRRHRQRPSRGQAAGRRRRPTPRAADAARHADGAARRARKQLLDELGPKKFADWMRDAEARAGHRHHHARRAPVAARHAHAHATTCVAVADAYARAAAAAASRSNAGAARPSTSPCASCRRTRGSGCAQLRERDAEHPAPDAAARRQRASATPTIPTTSCATSSARRPTAGIDVFRVFDSLNWVENMRVAIDAVREAGKLCEAAICYTGDILDPDARQVRPEVLRRPGAGAGEARRAHPRHQGHGRAAASRAPPTRWSRRCSEEIGLPIHFHTHDTSRHRRRPACSRRSRPASTPSTRRWTRCRGLTSQPCLGSIVEALRRHRARHRPRPRGDPPASPFYWEAVRNQYAAFESDLQAPARPRSICTRCRAASSPTSRSRRARSASRRAGTRSRRPTPRSTSCSATSSRSRRPRRWSATWRC